MIDIGGGRRMHLLAAGPPRGAGPTALLEAGSFGFSADWAAVQAALAARAMRSVAYDRAGLGFSDPGPAPRDGLAIAADLEALLAAAGETGPFVLCGHSMGGLHLHLYAARNRERIAGVVLADAATPHSMDSRRVSAAIEQFGHATRLAAWGAQAGFFGPFAATFLGDKIGLEGAASLEKRWAFARGSHNRWAAEEVGAWAAAARQAVGAGDLDPAWPVAVVLAGPPDERAWLKSLLAAPARAAREGRVEHIPAADHASLLGLRHADVVARAVEWVRVEAGVKPVDPA
ncbi:MAG: alpha/beta fold hydrolase [Caulobacteraceae bacterium]